MSFGIFSSAISRSLLAGNKATGHDTKSRASIRLNSTRREEAVDAHVAAIGLAQVRERPLEGCQAGLPFAVVRRIRQQNADASHALLLRACRERPRRSCAAECGQQFPSSNGDCHTPLPCEVRKKERYHVTMVQSS